MSSDASGVAQDHLRSFVERVERLEEEKKTIAEDIKDVYAEAKGTGFDTKVLRKVISLRKQDANERAEQDAILDLYLQALGMTSSGLNVQEEMDGMERVRRSEIPGAKKDHKPVTAEDFARAGG